MSFLQAHLREKWPQQDCQGSFTAYFTLLMQHDLYHWHSDIHMGKVDNNVAVVAGSIQWDGEGPYAVSCEEELTTCKGVYH